jgi:hypothetical protein
MSGKETSPIFVRDSLSPPPLILRRSPSLSPVALDNDSPSLDLEGLSHPPLFPRCMECNRPLSSPTDQLCGYRNQRCDWREEDPIDEDSDDTTSTSENCRKRKPDDDEDYLRFFCIKKGYLLGVFSDLTSLLAAINGYNGPDVSVHATEEEAILAFSKGTSQ